MNAAGKWLAAALVMLALQAVAADTLPRVFFSPQERADIVQRRSIVVRTPPGAAVQAPVTVAVAAADAHPPAPAQAARPVLRLEGLSIASSGATFAWINGKRYANGERVAGHRLDISPQGVVIVDARGHSRRIRVGEDLDGPAVAAGTKP